MAKVGRPASPNKIRVCVKLDKDLYKTFKDSCDANGKSYSEAVEHLITVAMSVKSP